jgi:hypothetical protein
MKKILLFTIGCLVMGRLAAEDITTLDGQTYTDVKDVALKPQGLFFVSGTGDSMRGVTVPYDNLPDDVKDRYHYDPFEMGFTVARQDAWINLSKKMVFSLDQLDAAEKKAKAEKKMLGFIMEWDSYFGSARPMGQGGNDALAQFYEVFHNGLVLIFVRHESELDKVPDAVKKGFQGPDEGGYAPNMAVVTADCSQFICEIPYGGKDQDGAGREQIFRQKIAVIKSFKKTQ